MLLKKPDNLYNQFMENELDSRLTEIEIKLSYLEDFMNKIQKITVEHTETIEKLKAENPMQWVGLMNNCKAQAEETILRELVYS